MDIFDNTHVGEYARRATFRPRSKNVLVLDLYPIVRPWLHRLDPERAHELTLRVMELGLTPVYPHVADPILHTRLFDCDLPHPLGLAAGFDKNARVISHVFKLGLAWAEVGGVTPRAQGGNPRPRVFRLPADSAVINRMGFPNDGAERVLARLSAAAIPGLTGVNIASNIESTDPLRDFVGLAEAFAPHTRFLTLDISCPNTANGQVFLDPDRLRELLSALGSANLGAKAPVLVAKLSPDIDADKLARILDVLEDGKIGAICIGNTTLQRPDDLKTAIAERGGLSGKPLFAMSTRMLSFVRGVVGDRIPLIGTGGIFTGEDAYLKIRAGASVLQLYTALIYEGPGVVERILTGLAACLRRDGFTSISDAVGVAPSAQDLMG
jgi:dihydroorotate dehydrogenase